MFNNVDIGASFKMFTESYKKRRLKSVKESMQPIY